MATYIRAYRDGLSNDSTRLCNSIELIIYFYTLSFYSKKALSLPTEKFLITSIIVMLYKYLKYVESKRIS